MTEPLTLTFDVRCSREHAFRVWTVNIAQWWPSDHTVSGDPADIVVEGVVGGRIFERTADGTVHEWGEVTAWDPPRHLGYQWYLRQDRADATQVNIIFSEHGAATEYEAATTRIEIEHHGWDRLGVKGPDRRRANVAGWRGLLPHFIEACGGTP
jgi:uncharacterized protein YndB with AHSA1/START domain